MQPVVTRPLQLSSQARGPPSKPSVTQLAPPRSGPSQTSVPVRVSSPQTSSGTATQLKVSISSQVGLQPMLPLAKPSLTQVAPPTSLPSHTSPAAV